MSRILWRIALAMLGLPLLCPWAIASQTAKQLLGEQLTTAGVEDVAGVTGQVEQQLGGSLDISLHDRVDFSSFPEARLNLTPLKAPATLVLTPQTANYVFRGKPDSFQGKFRSYEFHLGEGLVKASSMIYPQLFEQIHRNSTTDGLSTPFAIIPTLEEFRFRWGGTFTPTMLVSLRLKVDLLHNGQPVFSKSYAVDKVKEGAGSLFPNEKQEYKAISRALLDVCIQSAREFAELPLLRNYRPPAPKPKLTVATLPPARIDMDAILFLADTMDNYHRNKGRLTLLERRVAFRLLRLREAWDNNDADQQATEVLALVQYAKTLEPVSQGELLEEIGWHQKFAQADLIERNAAEDRIFNFAGNNTDNVLEYAGIGIEITKVAVLAAGCLADPLVTCPTLAGTMAQGDIYGTVAEGIGAGTEEYFHKSGDLSTALYQGAKASVIDYAAGSLGGKTADKTAAKAAELFSKKYARTATSDLVGKQATKMRDNIFVRTMELTYRAPTAGVEALTKDAAKRIEAKAEELLFCKKARDKALPSLKQETTATTNETAKPQGGEQ